MPLPDQIRRTLKRLLVGSADFHQQCTLALRAPQSEISVRLHGLGPERDVTHSHMMACAAPFTVGVGLCPECDVKAAKGTPVSLNLYDRTDPARLLGRIRLQLSETIPVGEQHLYFFELQDSTNYCLPAVRLWAQYLYYEYKRWSQPPEVQVTSRVTRAVGVFFICPRPVALVSTGNLDEGNIFPMNLMGSIGNGYFAFALTTARPATSFVERSGRIVLSTLPVERAKVAFELGRNHRKECVDWSEFPFATKKSMTFGLPVPDFALRVTEMQIEVVRKMGSHTLFVATALRDEQWADGDQFFMIHGTYNSWRQRLHT